MVQIQSSWFPLYDRNPQTFVPNIGPDGVRDRRAAARGHALVKAIQQASDEHGTAAC